MESSAFSRRKTKPMSKSLSNPQVAALLISIVLANAGYWSCIDFPQSLGDEIIGHFRVTTEQLSLLYTLDIAMGILTAPVAGILIANQGIANLALFFNFLIVIGSYVMYFAVEIQNFQLLLLGRAIYSLGGEPVLIAQSSASEKWFYGRILSLSLGLNQSCGLGSSSLSNFLNPSDIIKTRNLERAFLYYCCATSLSFIASALFYFLDYRYTEEYNNAEQIERLKMQIHEDEYRIMNPETLTPPFGSGGRDGEDQLESAISQSARYRGSRSGFRLSDLSRFGVLFWCTVGIYAIVSNAYYQFTFIATNLAIHRYDYGYLKAKNFLSIIQLLAACLMPFNSYFIQKFGKKLKVIFLSSAILFISYLNLAATPAGPSPRFEISIALITAFYILYQSTIFSCLALSVPKDVVSVGFGIASFFQAIPLSSLSFLIGWMVKGETEERYQNALYVLLGNTILGFVLVLVSIEVDIRNGSLLDAPESNIVARKAKKVLDYKFRRLVKSSRGKRKNGKRRRRRRGKGASGGGEGKRDSSKVKVETIRAGSEFNRSKNAYSGFEVDANDEESLN